MALRAGDLGLGFRVEVLSSLCAPGELPGNS